MMRWYIIHVYSGFEAKIAQQIKLLAQQKGLGQQFGEILIPSERSVEVRKGQKYTTEQRAFPGYIMIQMDMSDEAWHLVKSTPKVTGFLGDRTRPTPVSEAEIATVTRHVTEAHADEQVSSMFEVGMNIRVTDGPFTSFSGVIEDIDIDKGRMKVGVSIFGRLTPVELEFGQVEKA